MSEVWCYAYAEDILSCVVMEKVVSYCNTTSRQGPLRFNKGFPANKQGFGNLKKIIPQICNMAKANIVTIVLTDLDLTECSPELIRRWFGLTEQKPSIPDNVLFRVAEREVEAWLLADRGGIADFLEISEHNFSSTPDQLDDPKQHLMNVIRAKGRKSYHKDMLPDKNAHLGIEYNPRLSDFVKNYWSVERAAEKSPSLKRAIEAINKL